MFSHLAPSDLPAGRWRHALRHAVSVAVAFATLDDGEAGAEAGGEAANDAPWAPATRRHSPPDSQAITAHPHRRPLGPPARARRPAQATPRPQACSTPLALRHPRGGRAAHPLTARAQRSRAYSTPGSPRWLHGPT
jgi:hypothetical protein